MPRMKCLAFEAGTPCPADRSGNLERYAGVRAAIQFWLLPGGRLVFLQEPNNIAASGMS